MSAIRKCQPGRNLQRQVVSCVAGAVAVLLARSPALADVVFGDFESGTAPGFGALSASSGVQPWAPPVNGQVITAGSGPLAGSKVLELTGQESFNFGQGAGAALGFNFLSQGLRADFLANDQLEFDWYPVPNGGSGGFSQLYNITLNSQGGGYTNVDGYSFGNAAANQFYFTGYTGVLHHLVVNYTNYKNTILASANPDGGGWLELAIQPNVGGGAPADYYFDNFKLSAAPTIWNVDADGAWSTDSNWSPQTNPNAAGKVVSFGPTINSPRTVTVDAPRTVGQINFNNSNKYTIAGTSTLTLDSTSSVGITVSNGSHDITAPLSLAKDLNINVGTNTLTLSNLQPSTVAITKAGAGALAVNNVRAGALSVSAGSVSILSGRSANGTSKVGSLSIAGGAALDLADQDLIVDSSTSQLANVKALIISGYNNGSWNGSGIRSSAALSGFNGHSTALGYAQASSINAASFSGQTLTNPSTATLVRYTLRGDSNLSGSVDLTDFTFLAANFNKVGGAEWLQGDYNYDGNVDLTDFTFLASNFNQTLPGSSLGAAVPEPGSIGLAAVAMTALVSRRRRNVAR